MHFKASQGNPWVWKELFLIRALVFAISRTKECRKQSGFGEIRSRPLTICLCSSIVNVFIYLTRVTSTFSRLSWNCLKISIFLNFGNPPFQILPSSVENLLRDLS